MLLDRLGAVSWPSSGRESTDTRSECLVSRRFKLDLWLFCRENVDFVSAVACVTVVCEMVDMVLHWGVALVVFGLFALGLWMVGLDYYSAWRKDAPDLHKTSDLPIELKRKISL